MPALFPEVRPTSHSAALVDVGRSSNDNLRLGTRQAVSRLIRGFSAAFLAATVWRFVVETWDPHAGLSARMRLEMRILVARWLGIAFVAIALAFDPAASMPLVFAYAILAIALVYTIVLRKLIAAGHRSVEDGGLPATGDVVLCALMLPIFGGFIFPFYAILYLVTLSAGMRLGLQRGTLLAVSIGALDAASNVLSGGSLANAGYVIRTGVLLAIVPITSYMHDEARKSETDLAERLRQSEVLNRTLQYQALHDGQTGLWNRAHLLQRLNEALEAADSQPALLVIGLERFDEINDTFGHESGDMLLAHISRRLCAATGAAGAAARVGGEQFAVLLWDTDRAAAERVAQALLSTLTEPFAVVNCEVAMSGSVGIALGREHGPDADLLLRRADVAMSAARRRGAGYAFYSPEQDQHNAERLALAPELRRAIENDELTLWYQPKLNLASGQCIGVEALVRWMHPQRGIVPPDQFIQLAEQTGLIRQLSDWVLNAALQQYRDWRDTGLVLPIAVNLSMHDLQNPRLLNRVSELLRRWAVPSGDLLIEITESSLMVDPAHALATVTGLRNLGVSIAIDDFGTGYSSLGYLKRLPVDELKIDKSFVQDLATDEDDLAIVRSTIRLGHDLGLSVTAEGVENSTSLSLLRELGCDVAQGYYIGRPRPPEVLVAERRPRVVVLPARQRLAVAAE